MKFINITGKNSLFLIITSFLSPSAYSEVTLDGSMGATGTLSGPDYQITQDVGKLENGNLFHSFRQFNINSTESATFSGSTGIKNVISRVTGGQASTIDGVFRSTISGANVYFLNPSGVIFGENASLDVQGSFHASTADYLRFKDGVKFETGVATANPILTTATPEAFGFLDDTPAKITVSGGNSKVLEVPENATLSLIGGDISIKDKSLYAPSGQVVLASAGSAGELVFNQSGIDTSSFTKGGNIHISHAADNPVTIINNDSQIADIDVSADSAGKIVIRGGQMVMDNAYIWADTTNKNGGNIDIGLAGNLTINGVPESADVENTPQSGIIANSLGTGNAGNIQLNVDRLKLSHGTRIDSISLSSGDGGDLTINTNSILLEGNESNAVPRLTSSTNGTGNAGNITLNNTNKLEVSKGAFIRTYTTAEGNTGAITVNTGSLELYDGSQINSKVTKTAVGNSGDLTINASHSINMSNNTTIANDTDGKGIGANLIVNADSISISDESVIQNVTSGEGNAGNTAINTNTLKIKNGNILNYTKNIGNAGNLTIDTGSLELFDGSGINSKVTKTAEGNSGDLTINAGSISILDESDIKNVTNGEGNAGNLTINSNALTVKNGNILNHTNSTGNAGNLTIDTGSLELFDGTIGTASRSSATGENGNINIKANSIFLEGDSLTSHAEISGSIHGKQNTGSLSVEADKLEIKDWASISMNNFGEGNTGDLFVNASEIVMTNTAGGNNEISANLYDTGNSGNLSIESNKLILRNGSSVSIANVGIGHSGILSVKIDGDIILNGTSIYTSSQGKPITQYSGINNVAFSSGQVGNTLISAKNILLKDNAEISTGAISSSPGGNLFIEADHLVIQESSLISTGVLSLENSPVSTGDAGDMDINVNQLEITNSFISTTTNSAGNGGNLSINANNIELNNSVILTSTDGPGNAGNLAINVDENLFLNNESVLTTLSLFTDFDSTNQPGIARAGNLTITSNGTIRLDNNSAIASKTAKADAGFIKINGETIVQLHNKSGITSKVSDGQGQGGDIFIDNPIVALDDSVIQAGAVKGAGGNITISGFLFQSPLSDVTASSELNADGQLNLKPETNISGNLAVLPESLLNASVHFSDRCVTRSEENKNSFVIKSKGGVPLSPSELSPSHFLDYSPSDKNQILPNTEKNTRSDVNLKNINLVSYNNISCTQ